MSAAAISLANESVSLASASIKQLWTARHISQHRKQLWKLLRQFQSPDQFSSEFGVELQTAWHVQKRSGSQGEQAIKLALANHAGQSCESVLLLPSASHAQRPRATVCVSSQPGCGVGCPFCATGKLGFRGNLSAEQICEQVYWAGIEATKLGRHVRNVVFMGMGEPLHNPEAVFEAIDWLTSDVGFGLSPRRLTVSTVGVPAQMQNLVHKHPGVKLALSLHSAIPEQRRVLVPRAIGDLAVLKAAISAVNQIQIEHPVWLEIVLLAGINDTVEHQKVLAQFCADIKVEVNLIPYNAIDSSEDFKPSPKEVRDQFANYLREKGIRTTIRSSFGNAQSAACGQLAGTN